MKVTPYILVGVSAFILNFVWEWLQLPLYTGYEKLGSGVPLILFATLGDVVYILGGVLLVALFKRKLDWLSDSRAGDYIGLAMIGFFVALMVEYKALSLHRWAYAPAMPIVFGVGLSPLVQMTLLLPLCVGIAHWFSRKRGYTGWE